MKTIWKMLLELLGYPTPPKPEQIGEKLVTMRQTRDCHNAAVATACGVTYEQAHKALWHFNLPLFFESPLLSNPLNVKRGVEALGFKAAEIGLQALLNSTAKPGRVIVLVHDPRNPLFAQHWVVWLGYNDGQHELSWGDSQTPKRKGSAELIDLVTGGWPNCVFEVG